MTITSNAHPGFENLGRSIGIPMATAAGAVITTIRQWRLDAVQSRATSALPAHLKRDIGEIDHLPPISSSSFVENDAPTYQDRLQQMWMR